MRIGLFGMILLLGLAFVGAQAAAFGGGSSSSSSKAANPDYTQAVKLIEAGDFASAKPLLEKVVQADPTNADAYNYLGYSLRKLGDRDQALSNYMQALQIAPEHLGANEYLGELYLEMSQIDKAKERLKVLDKACFFGCEEYRELKEKIAAYEAKAGS